MKSRRSLIVTLGLALLAIAGGAGFVAWRARDRTRGIVLSGTVETRDVQVGSLVGGRVIAVHVDEGATVKAGQTLVTLEPDLLDLEIREQRAKVEAARAALARSLAGPRSEELARARVDWENAERERVRLEALRGEGVVGQQQYDDATARAATTREQYQQLQRGTRVEDIAEARARADGESGRLAYLERQREETVVKSPVDGVLQSFDLRPGDLVQPNQPVATILEADQLWIRVYVPEPKLGLVRVGQPAAVQVDTFPGREFPGKVIEIRDHGEYIPRNIQTLDERTDQVFGVKIGIDPTPEIKPGMAAMVRILP